MPCYGRAARLPCLSQASRGLRLDKRGMSARWVVSGPLRAVVPQRVRVRHRRRTAGKGSVRRYRAASPRGACPGSCRFGPA